MGPKGKSKAQFNKNQLIGINSHNKKLENSIDSNIEQQTENIVLKNTQLSRLAKDDEDLNKMIIYYSNIQNKKKLDEDIKKQIEENELAQRQLRDLKIRKEQMDIELLETNKLIKNKSDNLSRKHEKLNSVTNEVGFVSNSINDLDKTTSYRISNSVRKRRIKNPTTEDLPKKAKVIRRNETLKACSVVHGATKSNITPAIDGMLETLTSKCSAKLLSTKILNSKTSMVGLIKKTTLKSWAKEYFKSQENLLRSVNVYYSHHVMGKRKYINVRKANKSAVYKSTKVPNFVPYSVLSNHINSTDIGTVSNISPEFTQGLEECGEGMYRPLAEYALRLAKFYLHVDRYRVDKLKSFPFFPQKDNNSTLFVMSFGGDGAPGSGCAFLLSFLNVGKRVASSFENFLIFGANVEETYPVVKFFVLKTIHDIKYLESKAFDIMLGETQHKVEFVLGELPNDMKMLYFLAGELSNSATYFSTFANVTQANSTDIEKKMGYDWVQFNYHKRLSDAAKVEIFSKSVEKTNIAVATKRQKITSYISTKLHSRQEKIPLVKEYVDRAKCEPLHIKNNVVAQIFVKLQKEVLKNSDVRSFKSFNDIPENNLYRRFVSFVKHEMNCNQLANKMQAWFNEEYLKNNTKDFRFRFRGIESYSYLKKFPNLIRMILFHVNMENARYKVCHIFLESLYLKESNIIFG